MTSFQILTLVLNTLVLVVAVGTAIFSWRVRQRQVDKEEVQRLRERLTRAESRLDETPTSKALHELAISITQFGGDLKAVTARLDGLGEIVGRLERITERQEQYLLERGGK